MIKTAKKIIIFLLLTHLHKTHSIITWQETIGESSPTTFSHPITHFISNSIGKMFYVAVNKPSTNIHNQQYKIAGTDINFNTFFPLAHQKVSINGISNQNNPFYEGTCGQMGLLENNYYGETRDYLLLVNADHPQYLYVLLYVSNGAAVSLTKSNEIMSAIPEKIGAITSCTGIFNDYICAAVKPGSESNFGTIGSGIVTFYYKSEGINGKSILSIIPQIPNITLDHEKNIESNRSDTTAPTIITPNTASTTIHTEVSTQEEPTINYPSTTPLDNTHHALCYNGTINIINDNILIRTNQKSKSLYIGTSITTGTHNEDMGCAIAMGKYNTSMQLTLMPLLPNSAIDENQDPIIAVKGANKLLTLHQIGVLHTSTGLEYLIVNRNDKKNIYALPLTSGNTDTNENGLIAANDAIPEPYFDPITKISCGRALKKRATSPENTPNKTDNAVLVGNNGTLPDDIIINNFVLVSDAILIATNKGVWHSRALFNGDGLINGWTNWRIYANIFDPVNAISYNHVNGTIIIMTNNGTLGIGDTIHRTQWGTGDTKKNGSLLPLLGSVSSLHTITMEENNTPHTHLLCALDTNRCVIANVTRDNNTVNGINYQQYTTHIHDTTIDTINDAYRVLILNNNTIDHIAPLTTLALVNNHNNGPATWWCGGYNGLMYFNHTNKNECQGSALQKTLSYTHATIYGNYKSIKKITYDNPYLYILTSDQLDRIAVHEIDMPAVTLAHRQSLIPKGYHAFNDMVISEKIGLLATTNGLYRIANHTDIRLANNAQELNWQPITICGNDTHHIKQCFCVSRTGNPQDSARYNGGNIYFLIAAYNNNNAYIARCAIKEVVTQPITDNTVVMIKEPALRNQFSYFAHLSHNCSQYASDGAIHLHANGNDTQKGSTINNLLTENSSCMFPKTKSLRIKATPEGGNEAPLFIQHPYGSWISGNDNGIYINE